MRPIYIVNNFGQTNHLIKRMLRDLDIEAEMINNTVSVETVREEARGIILGGGPTLERIGNGNDYVNCGLPVLGICLGLHTIANACGGRTAQGCMGGFGGIEVRILEKSPIFEGYGDTIKVWASHADEVKEIPAGFAHLAESDVCPNEAIADEKRHIYGVQWHPEVAHSENGKAVFENFDRITQELL